jgi:hypothetical protein
MEIVVTGLEADENKDQQTNGNTRRKPGDIDDGIRPVAKQLANNKPILQRINYQEVQGTSIYETVRF